MHTTTPGPQAPAPDPSPTGQPAQAPETDWKAEARKWETRAKENRAAAKERDELAEALKAREVDLEALRAKVTRFEKARQVDTWRTQVATETGVPVDLLRGQTLEEISSHAQVLRTALAARSTGPVVPPSDGAPGVSSDPMSELARSLFGRS